MPVKNEKPVPLPPDGNVVDPLPGPPLKEAPAGAEVAKLSGKKLKVTLDDLFTKLDIDVIGL